MLGEVFNMSMGQQLVLGSDDLKGDLRDDLKDDLIKDESSEGPQHKRYSSHPHNIEEAEDLLETYFMRVSCCHGGLSKMPEVHDCHSCCKVAKSADVRAYTDMTIDEVCQARLELYRHPVCLVWLQIGHRAGFARQGPAQNACKGCSAA